MDYRDTSFPVIHSYLKMQRYFIYLSFNGAQYHGWQIQPNGTVSYTHLTLPTICSV